MEKLLAQVLLRKIINIVTLFYQWNQFSMTIPNYWVYILICENGSYYTGYTNHLLRRYREHVKGTNKCKYTRSFKPIQLAQSWGFADKVSALKAEKLIKKLTKEEKKRLIINSNLAYTDLKCQVLC